MQKQGIEPWNTRVMKVERDPVPVFEVRVAAAAERQEPAADVDGKFKVKVQYGKQVGVRCGERVKVGQQRRGHARTASLQYCDNEQRCENTAGHW